MAKTVDEGFSTFHSWLTPSQEETQAAKNHRASIEACLKSNFNLTRFFRSGSFGNGTSIRGYSDVDFFASIPREKLTQNSGTTLRRVCEALDARFPRTEVHVDTPAVVVPFGADASESTEVIPADCIEEDKNGFLIYEIADGNGGWMRTSPDAHNSYVAHANKERGEKVKPLVRFLKAWKYYRNVPISSFYLEMRVAQYALRETTIIFDIDVRALFQLLWDSQLAAMQDPMGISGYIYPCNTQVQKTDSLSKLYTALTRANNARASAANGSIQDAFYWWKLVYDSQFPSYG